MTIEFGLNEALAERHQTLAQMSLAWVLYHPGITSAIVGVSRVAQLDENLAALNNLEFSPEELALIDEALESRKK